MKVELTANDLNIIQQALDVMTIKGKDAKVVSEIIDKVDKAFTKEVEKQNG